MLHFGISPHLTAAFHLIFATPIYRDIILRERGVRVYGLVVTSEKIRNSCRNCSPA